MTASAIPVAAAAPRPGRPRLRLLNVLPPDADRVREAPPAAAPAAAFAGPGLVAPPETKRSDQLAKRIRQAPDTLALMDVLAAEFAEVKAQTMTLKTRVIASERAAEQSIRCGDVVAYKVNDLESEIRGFERRLIAIESFTERIYQTFESIERAAAVIRMKPSMTEAEA